MIEILDFIKSIFPTDWLSNMGENLDEFGEIGVDISHPANQDIELSILILAERVGIAVLKKNEKEILLDLGGFDYTFEKQDKETLQEFLLYFCKTGRVPYKN
jgi:hypothetical protein